jgi:heme/copper-type cytochrome/quinol oxidase subunit 1
MGAVFAIFGGFYYWFEKMFGIKYNELYARIHFWTFFIGVNITFFPMHFLGLAGMPRRIPDYPDAYFAWNYIASIGSVISIIASLFFFYILYNAFSVQVLTTKRTSNPWVLPIPRTTSCSFYSELKGPLNIPAGRTKNDLSSNISLFLLFDTPTWW